VPVIEDSNVPPTTFIVTTSAQHRAAANRPASNKPTRKKRKRINSKPEIDEDEPTAKRKVVRKKGIQIIHRDEDGRILSDTCADGTHEQGGDGLSISPAIPAVSPLVSQPLSPAQFPTAPSPKDVTHDMAKSQPALDYAGRCNVLVPDSDLGTVQQGPPQAVQLHAESDVIIPETSLGQCSSSDDMESPRPDRRMPPPMASDLECLDT
jgi:hypothetical protein